MPTQIGHVSVIGAVALEVASAALSVLAGVPVSVQTLSNPAALGLAAVAAADVIFGHIKELIIAKTQAPVSPTAPAK
jgi:hypothetical protein